MNSAMSILIVDNQPHIRRILARTVVGAGFVPVEATDCADALEKLDSGRFEIVIADLAMPDNSGKELVIEIRDRFPDTSVIGVTDAGYSRPSGIVADGLISKPFHNLEIIRQLRLVVQNRRSNRSSAARGAPPDGRPVS